MYNPSHKKKIRGSIIVKYAVNHKGITITKSPERPIPSGRGYAKNLQVHKKREKEEANKSRLAAVAVSRAAHRDGRPP
jgi:hypothetical protein